MPEPLVAFRHVQACVSAVQPSRRRRHPSDRAVSRTRPAPSPTALESAQLLAELSVLRDQQLHFGDELEVGSLKVGDVIVLDDGTCWSVAPIGVVRTQIQEMDLIRDLRSWTQVIDDNL